ncbi:MAG: type IV pilus assembly protein PilM [Candidatus Omnitrophota bacterium]
MDFKTIFKKEYVVGLDIGSSSVKTAVFIEKEDGPFLLRSELKEIKRTNDPASDEAGLAVALRFLFRDIDTKKSVVIASVNCTNTAVKKITTPYMPKSELREGIRLQAKSYFPFPIDESMLDFEITGDIVDKGTRKYEILVAACPIDTTKKYLSALSNAGIKPSSVISSSYALCKVAEMVNKEEGYTNCLIDIGQTHTELVILKGKQLMFTRKIPVSGSDFTSAMTGAVITDKGKAQLTFDEAEKIKCSAGILSGAETAGPDAKISVSQISAMLRAPEENFTSEVERCIDYYREDSAGGKVDSIILFGGGAALNGLTKILSEELGIDVRLGDSFHGIKASKEVLESGSRLSHRLNLAIGAAFSKAEGINLLPSEIKDEKKILIKRSTLEAAGTAVLLILVLLYAGMTIKLTNFQKRISAARMELSTLEPQIKKAKTVLLGNQILSNEPQWEDVFVELSNLMPDNIHLTGFHMKDDMITLRGVVAAQDGEQVLSDFILTLESGLFDRVRLVNTKKIGEDGGTEFELNCRVDYEK